MVAGVMVSNIFEIIFSLRFLLSICLRSAVKCSHKIKLLSHKIISLVLSVLRIL